MVVTGFANERVDAVVEQVRDINVRTLHNPMFAHTDNLGTCWEARSEMDGPFVLMNGDTLFEAAVLQRLLNTVTMGFQLPWRLRYQIPFRP